MALVGVACRATVSYLVDKVEDSVVTAYAMTFAALRVYAYFEASRQAHPKSPSPT